MKMIDGVSESAFRTDVGESAVHGGRSTDSFWIEVQKDLFQNFRGHVSHAAHRSASSSHSSLALRLYNLIRVEYAISDDLYLHYGQFLVAWLWNFFVTAFVSSEDE